MTRRRWGALLACSAAGALIVGCAAPVGVKRVSPREVHRALTSNVLTSGSLSNESEIVLRRYDLTPLFEEDPAAAIARLHEIAQSGQGDDGLYFALAETSFSYAEKTKSQRYFLGAAVYALAFLFPEGDAPPLRATDPRVRAACDIYNRALTDAFLSPQTDAVELNDGMFPLPFGWLYVDFDESSLLWGQRRLKDFVPVAELKIHGLRNRYRQPGIGAPLAAATVPVDPNDEPSDLVGPKVRVPVTAVLRIDQPRQQLTQTEVRGTLALYATTDVEDVEIAGQRVPLESEPTAALATALSETRLWDQELAVFLGRLANVKRRTSLFAERPYRRGRIPVVFVHGTASSPARWANMVNDLDSDVFIRQHFQFWFFTYDSGNPIAFSSMQLRQALASAVQHFDPNGTDPCLHEMVVIGHSQGGLLTKMTAIDSGSKLWNNVSRKPIDEVRISDESRKLLQDALFIKPLPFVSRVVFIATPHRGSYLAGSQFAQRLAAWLITMPTSFVSLSADITGLTDGTSGYLSLERIPTSIDNMSPGNQFIQTLSEIPVSPTVSAHSIIGVEGGGPNIGGGDGVVKFESAHIDGVESELVVNCEHSMQARYDVIAEVSRILHLQAKTHPCWPEPVDSASGP